MAKTTKKAAAKQSKTTNKLVSVSKLEHMVHQANYVLDPPADKEKATAELNRMIKLHSDRAAHYDHKIKAYLLGHAKGKYIGQYRGECCSLAGKLAIHSMAIVYLQNLKEQLGA